jgi:hypothetical protein
LGGAIKEQRLNVAGKLDAPDYAAWPRRFDRVLRRKSDQRGITLRSALWLIL